MKHSAWAILVIAGVFEIGFSVGLKYSEGFTRLWLSVATAIMIVSSLGLVRVATRSLPLGTAYAIWTGIGAVGTSVLGIVMFGESASLSRLHGFAQELHGCVWTRQSVLRHFSRGLGTRAATSETAAASDWAPENYGRVAPRGSVRPVGGRRGAGNRSAGDERPEIRLSLC